jgi:hypothetical protein
MDESNSVPDPEEMDMESVPDPHRDPLCSTCKHSRSKHTKNRYDCHLCQCEEFQKLFEQYVDA